MKLNSIPTKTAAALYASEFTVPSYSVAGRDDVEAGLPLDYLALRFRNSFVVSLCEDIGGHDLPPGRYRAELLLTRIDE